MIAGRVTSYTQEEAHLLAKIAAGSVQASASIWRCTSGSKKGRSILQVHRKTLKRPRTIVVGWSLKRGPWPALGPQMNLLGVCCGASLKQMIRPLTATPLKNLAPSKHEQIIC